MFLGEEKEDEDEKKGNLWEQYMKMEAVEQSILECVMKQLGSGVREEGTAGGMVEVTHFEDNNIFFGRFCGGKPCCKRNYVLRFVRPEFSVL